MVTPKTWLPASCLSSVRLKIAASRCCWAASRPGPAPVSALLRVPAPLRSGLGGLQRARSAFLVPWAALSPDLCPHRLLLWGGPMCQCRAQELAVPGLHAPHPIRLRGFLARLGSGSSSPGICLTWHPASLPGRIRCPHASRFSPWDVLCAGPAAVRWRLPPSLRSFFSGK